MNQPILLVDDDPLDHEILIRAFALTGFSHPLHRCAEGEAALDYLHGRAGPRPGIILLDLNLAGTDPLALIREIKGDPGLRAIPLIVYTGSQDQRQVRACYRAGANSYIVKPVAFDDVVKLARRLTDYWFGVVVRSKEA